MSQECEWSQDHRDNGVLEIEKKQISYFLQFLLFLTRSLMLKVCGHLGQMGSHLALKYQNSRNQNAPGDLLKSNLAIDSKRTAVDHHEVTTV